MKFDINRVIFTGNLTADPELRSTQSGTPVSNLRVACNTARKAGDEWINEPNYFDVTVWGVAAENAARYLSKGRGVAVDGCLRWREWETEDHQKRQVTYIVADQLVYLPQGQSAQESNDSPAPGEESAQDLGAA